MWAASAYARFMNGISPITWASDEELAVVVRYAEESSAHVHSTVVANRCRAEMKRRAAVA